MARIDVQGSIKCLKEGYGLPIREVNHFTIRSSRGGTFIDWFHTTGTVVVCRNGRRQRLRKVCRDADDFGILAKNTLPRYDN